MDLALEKNRSIFRFNKISAHLFKMQINDTFLNGEKVGRQMIFFKNPYSNVFLFMVFLLLKCILLEI